MIPLLLISHCPIYEVPKNHNESSSSFFLGCNYLRTAVDCLCLLCRKIVNFLLVILTNNQLFSDITGCYLKTASYRWLQRFCLLFSKLLILNNQGHRRWLFSISNKVTSKNSVSMYVVSSKSEDYSWSYPIEYIFDRGHGSNDNWLGPI